MLCAPIWNKDIAALMNFAARIVCLASALLLCAAGAFAQTTVTTNGTDGNWSSPGTWTGGVVPNNGGGNSYNAQILNTPSAVTVTLDTNITVNALTLQSDTQLATVSGAALSLSSLDNSGDIEFVNGNTLAVGGPTMISATGTLSLAAGSTGQFAGDITNGGNFFTGLGGFGNNVVNIIGNVTSSGNITMFATGDTMSLSGTLNNSGSFNVFGPGAVANIAALNNTGSLTISVNSGGTINITGGGLGVTDVVAGSTIDVGGTFNLINGQTTTSALANLTSVEGNLILRNGQTTSVTPNGTDTLTFATGSMVDVSNDSTLQVNGNLTNNGSVRLGFYGGTADVLNVTGTLTNSGSIQMLDGIGDPIMAGELNNTGHLTIGAGDEFIITAGQGVTDIAAGSSIDVVGELLFQPGGMGPATSGFANLTTVEGALTLENGKTIAITPTTGTLSIASTGNFTIGGTGTVVNLTGHVSNMGTLVVGDGNNTLTVSGNVINSSGSVLVGMASTLGVTGAYQQTGAGAMTNIVGNLSAASFSQSAGTTIVQSGATLTAPTVQVTGGSFQGGGTILGDLTLTAGTLLPGTPDATDVMTLSGNYIQGPGGTMVIDISGDPAGPNSVFNISGLASLSGALDFTVLDGFTPSIGDAFTFLTFGSLSGDFSSIVFTNWTCPVGAICQDVLAENADGSGSLTLEITQAPPVNTPEPTSVFLVTSGLTACFIGRRRKRA